MVLANWCNGIFVSWDVFAAAKSAIKSEWQSIKVLTVLDKRWHLSSKVNKGVKASRLDKSDPG